MGPAGIPAELYSPVCFALQWVSLGVDVDEVLHMSRRAGRAMDVSLGFTLGLFMGFGLALLLAPQAVGSVHRNPRSLHHPNGKQDSNAVALSKPSARAGNPNRKRAVRARPTKKRT